MDNQFKEGFNEKSRSSSNDSIKPLNSPGEKYINNLRNSINLRNSLNPETKCDFFLKTSNINLRGSTLSDNICVNVDYINEISNLFTENNKNISEV